MAKVFVEILIAKHEIFGGYAYKPYAYALHNAIHNGGHIAHEAIKRSGDTLTTSCEEADIVLKVLERCPCCAGGAGRRDQKTIVVCPLPGIDPDGERYDFWMHEGLSFDDPENPGRRALELADGSTIPPNVWRERVIDGIVDALRASRRKTQST